MFSIKHFLSLVVLTHGMSDEGPIPSPSTMESRGSKVRPEDDILLQWRLRRKMEQARQWSHSTSHNLALYQPVMKRPSMQVQKYKFNNSYTD